MDAEKTDILFFNDRDVEVTDEDVDCAPISRAERVLREAEIPHILWGWWAAATHRGRQRHGGPIEFIVEDDDLMNAVQAFQDAGYLGEASTGTYPSHLSMTKRWNAWFVAKSDDLTWGPIILHEKSNFLWWLSSTLPTANPLHEPPIYGPRYALAHFLPHELSQEEDEAMLLPDDFAIPILNPAHYAEALMRLFCRDLDHPDDIKSHWAQHMRELVLNNPCPLDYIESELDIEYRAFWNALCRDAPFMDEARGLRRWLYDRQELPYVPYIPYIPSFSNVDATTNGDSESNAGPPYPF
ncbi:hypothetical protein N7492_000564 [Penicillium capsulatum]|uniref:Uncharacterized protein n=1 Tax=Penicillium capsulatum TaxID=69766 RepID=A0A9W9LYV6_9EURO|nr:hypothetical protein N7492_000564 [Penicillium capsulatum]KAJ6130378.1 hypothetical protein N7512_003158 [Penicillium capsulatum]